MAFRASDSQTKRRWLNHSHSFRFEQLENRYMLAADLLTTFGGAGEDRVEGGPEVDAAGNIYVAGKFSDTVDFDLSHTHPGDIDVLTSAGDLDVFVAKYDSTGKLNWLRQFGGTGLEAAQSIDLDPNGNVLISGTFRSDIVDFDATASYADDRDLLNQVGTSDGFVVKLDGNGAFQWVTGIHGTDNTIGSWITADSLSNVYLAGITRSSETNLGPFTLTGTGGRDGFVAKMDPSGVFQWVQPVASSGDDKMQAVVIDESDPDSANWKVIAAGFLSDQANVAGQVVAAAGETDVAVVQLSFDGQLQSVTTAGGPGVDRSYAVDLDPAGNIVVGGFFEDSVDFDPDPIGTATLTSTGYADAFIWKLDGAGNYVAAKRMGGTGFDTVGPEGLMVASDGTTYVTGQFYSLADFDSILLRSRGGADGYVAALDGNLDFAWAQQFGGGNGEVFFDQRVNDSGTWGWVRQPADDSGVGIALDGNGALYVAGDYKGTARFLNGEQRASAGDSDGLLWRLDAPAPRIRGNVFADFNGDGQNNDFGEGIQDGWVVYLDSNDNGQFDEGEVSTTTDGDAGFFDFGVVAPGDYVVRQQLPEGWTQTGPAGGAGHVLTVADGDGPVHVDFANQIAAERTTYSSADVPQNIRKDPVHSTLSIPQSTTVFDVNVTLSISHPDPDDLDVFLVGPEGTRVELFTDVGVYSNSSETVLDDETTELIAWTTQPLSGTYRPESPLAGFDYSDAQGTWTLEIITDVHPSTADRGTLHIWSLEILGTTPAPPAPTLAIDDVSVTEGDSGTVTAEFTVTRSGDLTQTATIDFATADGTATAGSDYAASLGTLTFDPGVETLTVAVTVNGDTDEESDETFFVNLTNAVGATITDAQGVGTILDDDGPTTTDTLFVYDISFDSKRGGRDFRAVFEIRSDSDGDGLGTANDAVAAGVSVTVTFAGQSYTGVTDSNGIFRTDWVKNLGSGDYYANVVDLALADFVWNRLALDLEDDSDGDGFPDDLLTV